MVSAGVSLRQAVSRIHRQAAPHLQHIWRLVLRRPILATALFLGTVLFCLIQIFHLLEHGDLGRWYYNWVLTVTPASLVRFIPKGDWGGPTDPPRWVSEIYESRWMGEWEVPPLTRPRWKRGHENSAPVSHHEAAHDGLDDLREQLAQGMEKLEEEIVGNKRARRSRRSDAKGRQSGTDALEHLPTAHPHTLSRRLDSPAILKFHVFSTAVSEKSRVKRHLIRRLSPLYQLPPEYRHLVDIKFVMGYNYLDTWGPPLNETMESMIREEEREYGDILRLPSLYRGENLRDGKILQWIRDVGQGKDGRDAWYLFKVDDDAVVNLPRLLDLLLSLNVHEPTYLGTSLARWPAYHNHFTGFLTGFNYGLYKTLSQGISRMSEEDVWTAWDDDVLTGELMYSLPPAPHCREPPQSDSAKCDPHTIPPYGWMPLPENPDPRTDLNRYDFVRTAGDPAWMFTIGDLAMHGWWFKFPEYWEKEWERAVKGLVWRPPNWIVKYADPDAVGS